jgi:hypothetical protein
MSPESQSPQGQNNTPSTASLNPVDAVTPSLVTTVPVPPAPQSRAASSSRTDSYDGTALTLYIVTILAGVSVLGSASYLVWNIINYFTADSGSFSFFDLSSFTLYVLIYIVLFTTLYALASLRLDSRIKKAGTLERPLRSASAVWRGILVIWGVFGIIGLLYSPLLAAVEGDASSLASEIISSLVGLLFVGLVFWRDLTVTKMRSGIAAVSVIAGLVLLIAGISAYASFNPKQPKQDSFDFESSSLEDF